MIDSDLSRCSQHDHLWREIWGPYASSNFNRVHLCGAEEGLTADGMACIANLFRQAGVERFYVWLSPGPCMEVVRGWLTDAGMTRRPHVGYPTLVRNASIPSGTTGLVEASVARMSEAISGSCPPRIVHRSLHAGDAAT
jgi:hypothetical protein